MLVEINNECNVRYDHAILKPERVHELIERVKAMHARQAPLARGHVLWRRHDSQGECRDARLGLPALHGNGVSDPKQIAEMVRKTRAVPGYAPKPILFNEDDHFDFDQAGEQLRRRR